MKSLRCLVLPAVVALGLVAWTSSRATGQTPSLQTVPFSTPFQAIVDRGPDAGMKLTGTLRVRINAVSGSTTGSLDRTNQAPLLVAGHMQRSAVNLFLDLGRSRYIFGAGTIVTLSRSRLVVLGGPLVGPRRGDSGEWLAQQQSGIHQCNNLNTAGGLDPACIPA